MTGGESFVGIMSQLQKRDDAAAAEVFRRFSGRLVGLARVKLGPQMKAKVDPEDVLQSVFRSFFARNADGEFQFDGWDGLWTMLTVITVRKCSNRRQHFKAARRDLGRESAAAPTEDGTDTDWRALARDPLPDEIAEVTETVEALLRGLDERDRQVVMLRLQGYEMFEIGEQVGCAERTVRRILEQTRRRLTAMGEADQ